MRFIAPVALVLLVGCAGTLDAASASPIYVPPQRLSGRVLYEARHETPTGASQALTRHPARFVRLVAVDAAGTELTASATDANGDFAFDAPAATARIRVVAEAAHVGTTVAVSPDARGLGRHGFEVVAGQAPIEIVALENTPAGDGGAFHLLDTMVRGAERVYAWTDRRLPPSFAFWGRGITSDWSYYHGEQPRDSGRYGIELLGGERGRQTSSDTDEHDEAIVLHEYGHFVFDVLSTDSSPGGTHPLSVLVEPGLAWEEGRASFFAGAVLGSPLYRDTIGLEPRGELRVDVNMETRGQPPRGIGSEGEVEEILWDLADGTDLTDTDADGIALGPARVLGLMFALRDVPGAFPCIANFLAFVVERGAVSRADMLAFLDRGGHPRSMLPAEGEAFWPLTLEVPGAATGKIDAITNPSPSGGAPRPLNGVDAVRIFRVHVTTPGYLEIALRIEGAGSQATRTDLDLELRDLRADLLSSSNGETASEQIARHVEPGYYIVVVRDGGGQGSRVGFEIRTRLTP